MLKNIIGIEVKKNYYSTNELKTIKRELTKKVYSANDDFIIHAYFNNYNKFIELIKNLNNRVLSSLSIKEIQLINFINKLDIITLNQLIEY